MRRNLTADHKIHTLHPPSSIIPIVMKSLRELALTRCARNANSFESLGDLPFLLIEPILARASASQLAHLEDQSPHLRDDTSALWHRHVVEKFKSDTLSRVEDESWREVYFRLKREGEEKLESAGARLREKKARLDAEKYAKRIVQIDPDKTPVVGLRKRTGAWGSSTPAKKRKLTAVNGSPPKKRNSIMEKARRDTSMSTLNYATAPPVSARRPLSKFSGLAKAMPTTTKVRREPAPPNDNNIFGRPSEGPRVRRCFECTNGAERK